MAWSKTRRGVGMQGRRKKKREREGRSRRGRGDEELDHLEMTVPQLTGDTKTIKLLRSSKAVKNPGLFT